MIKQRPLLGIMISFLLFLNVHASFEYKKYQNSLKLSELVQKKEEEKKQKVVEDETQKNDSKNSFEKDIEEIFSNPKTNSSSVSSNVAAVIDREMLPKQEMKSSMGKKNLYPQNITYPQANKMLMPDPLNQAIKNLKEKETNAQFIVKTAGFDLEKNKIEKQLKNFDLTCLFSNQDFQTDLGNGEIYLTRKISNETSPLSVVISKKDFLKTSTVLPIEKGAPPAMTVPLIEIAAFNKFLQKNKLTGRGGLLLVNLANDNVKVSIDQTFEKVFYFNDKFLEVTEKVPHQFVLFIGVNPGNVLLTYDINNNEISHNIVRVNEEECFYEEGLFEDKKELIVELYEGHLLGKKIADVDIKDSDIKFFSGNSEIKKNGALNRYEVLRYSPLLTQRTYFEFKHIPGGVFAGIKGKNKIEIPGENYIDQIYQALKIENLENQCIVQINLSKKPLAFDMDFSGLQDAMVTSYYLTDDGQLVSEINQKTVKIFLKGQGHSAINSRIFYADGTEDFLLTFCANETYLVEQI